MIKTVFDWVKQITKTKAPWSSFSDEEKELFNPYMVHRVLSMHEPYTDLVNMVQKIPYTEKEKIYVIYSEFLPKKDIWAKYIKGAKQPKSDIAEYLQKYYQCSLKEAKEYVEILEPQEIDVIFRKMGIEEKEIKKLLKTKS
jgi:hypothetical protein